MRLKPVGGVKDCVQAYDTGEVVTPLFVVESWSVRLSGETPWMVVWETARAVAAVVQTGPSTGRPPRRASRRVLVPVT